MKHNITDIFRIDTMNSVYEIKVFIDAGVEYSSCKKMGEGSQNRRVHTTGKGYLEKLTIGASFEVPGVVFTSVVQDYQHFVLSTEPKRTTIKGFFDGLVEEIKAQAQPPVQYHGEYLGLPGPDFPNGWTVITADSLPTQDRVYKGYGPGCSSDNHVGSCTCDLPPTCTVPGCSYSSEHGPSHDGSRMCKSGSIASGGTRAHCACDFCY